jgi:hypothetical protein
LRRKEREASRGSPKSFGRQKAPPQDDNQAGFALESGINVKGVEPSEK